MHDDLSQFNLGLNPVESFTHWYTEALTKEDNADAMTLATIDLKMNRPTTRTVLYKGLKDSRIIFYTNYESNKGKELESNPEVSLLFYWHKSIRQVRIQGKVEKCSEADSNTYWKSRDRESQLASYISNQSTPIKNKEELIEKLKVATLKFEGLEVPKPIHWGGYLVRPYEFEFFIYGKNRLNDRFLYELNQAQWNIFRLQP
jgi:pyridoxamine 5'-phosphate oxidase